MTTTEATNSPEELQDSPMPSEEQSQLVETISSEVGTSEASQETDVSTNLPDGVSDRTAKEFEKLKKQLREERERRMSYESSFGRGAGVKQETVDDKPLYDPKTGLVDVDALNDLQKQVRIAREQAEKADREQRSYVEKVQTQEALSVYPQLDPANDAFDESLHKATRAYLLDSMAYPESYGGHQLTYKQAADLAKGGFVNVPEATVSGLKEEASLGATGRPSQGVQRESSETQLQALRVGTRLGDKQSMIARLRALRQTSQS